MTEQRPVWSMSNGFTGGTMYTIEGRTLDDQCRCIAQALGDWQRKHDPRLGEVVCSPQASHLAGELRKRGLRASWHPGVRPQYVFFIREAV